MALRSLRGNIAKFLTKIFLLLLASSFLFWGINASLLQNNDNQTVATVGDTDISAQEYMSRLTSASLQFARRVGLQKLNTETIKRFGFDKMVLNNLINEKLLNNYTASHKLDISDEYLTEQIKEDPSFQHDGQFNKNIFAQVLRSNNFTEDDYKEILRNAYLRQQIVEAIFTPMELSPVFNDIYGEFLYNTLNIDYITITPKDLTQSLPAITPQDIIQYYKNHRDTFLLPAYRKLRYVKIDENNIMDDISVTEEEKRNYYSKHTSKYNTLEERVIEIITLPEKTNAQKFYEALLSGNDFYQLATKEGFSKNDLLIGQKTQQDISDSAIANKAFSLTENTFSEPTKTIFGFSIIRVTKIIPAKTTSYEQANHDIHAIIINDKKRDLLNELTSEFEQSRVKTSALDIVAKDLGYAYTDTPFIDNNGIQKNNKATTDPYITKELIAEAYKSDIGVENVNIDLQDGGSLWFEILDIQDPQFETLDNSKESIQSHLKEQKIQQELTKIAHKIINDARTNTNLFTHASTINKQVTTRNNLSRQSNDTQFSPNMLNDIFSHIEGEINDYYDTTTQTIYIYEITKRTRFLESQNDIINQQIQREFGNVPLEDFYHMFLTYLKSKYEVNINQNTIDNVLKFIN